MPILPAHLAVLACSVCGGRYELDEGTLRCGEGHAVDLARQGHVQLARRPIRHPGDTADMLAARARVHAAGTFEGLTRALIEAADQAEVVVEVGAGTAHHLAAVVEAGDRVGVALDSSKAAGKVAARAHPRVAAVVCDVTEPLPLQADSVDVLLVAFAPRNTGEFVRVLRPGGRLVFSTSHPVRWAFPDVPGPEGLTATTSYFDRTPYVEREAGVATYVEHHRTLGDLVRHVVAAGLRLADLVEPEWPERTTATWGGWSPLRGRLLPGTAILVCDRPD